jgi:regulatory protein
MTGNDSLTEKARQKAFRLLAARARSERELRSKLKEKGFDDAVIGEVTEKLRELKYLDDASFAEQWARNLGVNRLLGNRRIILSLKEKGIPPPSIERAINGLRREVSETDAIMKLIRKRLKSRSLIELDNEEKGKLARSLMGKGFPAELIYRTLNVSEEEFADDGE